MKMFKGWPLPPAILVNRTPLTNMFFLSQACAGLPSLHDGGQRLHQDEHRQATVVELIEVEEPVAVNAEENNDCLKIKRKSSSLLPLLPRQGGGERHPAGRPGHVQSHQVKKHHLFKHTRATDRKF